MADAEQRLLILLSRAFLNTRDTHPNESILFARAMLTMIDASRTPTGAVAGMSAGPRFTS